MSPTAELSPPFSGSRRHEKSVLEQPILEIGAVDEMQRAELAAGDHLPRLLHQRVATVVEGHRVHDTSRVRRVQQPPCVAG